MRELPRAYGPAPGHRPATGSVRLRALFAVAAAVLLTACGDGIEAEPTAIPYRMPSPTPTLSGDLYILAIPNPPEPTPAPTPEPPKPLPTPHVEAVAASAGQIAPLRTGIPWFVPPARTDDYLACLARPDRHSVSEMVWSRSLEAGYEGGWTYADAMYVVAHEGGDDLCQFNTQGSGACGPFQLLTCPADGLTPEGQLNGAFAKWVDGGRDFWRHWFQWWGR